MLSGWLCWRPEVPAYAGTTGLFGATELFCGEGEVLFGLRPPHQHARQLPGHLPLAEGHHAVTVGVGAALQALEEEVGEHAVPPTRTKFLTPSIAA